MSGLNQSSVIQSASLTREHSKSNPTSVSHLKTVAGVFDPVDGPKESSTNKNANEKKKDLTFNSRKHEGEKAISVSNNHFS